MGKKLIQLGDERMAKLKTFFANQPDILAVYLFGSYGTEFQTPDSDVDFAVLFSPGAKIDLMAEMSLLGRMSMILGEDRLDLVNLNIVPLRLQYKVISTGRLIYEQDYIQTCDFVEEVFLRYQDYGIDRFFLIRNTIKH
ncbi:MAG: nucleotidyltransferase domain-containing protein [Firmicutes bacterium]|nr:nucleotidyltransferase domain-containing protein [Bacillota bacterium]